MTTRPAIFISAVTRELQSARQLVATTLTAMGYQPESEEIFGAEQGNLCPMLRRRMEHCEGVIQLIGQCYGAEPPAPDAQFGRVSYTQYEALHARAWGKKVWYLLLDERYPADPHDPEPDALHEPQGKYRAYITSGLHLYHRVADATALELRVHQLRDELARLRHRWRQWATLVLVLLGVLVFFAGGQIRQVWEMRKQHTEDAAETNNKLADILRRIPSKLTQRQASGAAEDDEASRAIVFAKLEQEYGLEEGQLARELPDFIERLLASSETSPLDRANALYVKKDFAEAEKAYLRESDLTFARADKAISDGIEARELAGWAALEQNQYARALEHFRAAAVRTSEHRNFNEWSRVHVALEWALFRLGKYPELEDIARKVVGLGLERGESETREALEARHLLALVLSEEHKFAEAEAEHRAIYAIRLRVLGPEDEDTLKSAMNIANQLSNQGKLSEAEAEYIAVLAIQRRVLGEENFFTLMTRSNLAMLWWERHENDRAEKEFREILPLEERVMGPEHQYALRNRSYLALLLEERGMNTEAEAGLRSLLPIRERVLGPEHPDTVRNRSNLADVLETQDKHAEAEQEHRAVLAIRERLLDPRDVDLFHNFYKLALCLQAQAKMKEALPYAQRARDGFKRALGIEDSDTTDAISLCKELEAALAR